MSKPVTDSAPTPSIIDLALADPKIAFAIHKAVSEGRVKVAYPWVGAARQTRSNFKGVVVGEIALRSGGNYNAFVEGRGIGPKVLDEATAKALVDAELAKLGYVSAE